MTTWYEDFEIGRVYRFGTHAVEKAEIMAFARQWDPRDFHVDEAFARTTLFGEVTACGVNTLAIYTKLINEVTGDWAVRGALGYENLRFAHAVKDGDTLTGQTEIIGKRRSKSRSQYGIIRIHDMLTNQDGTTVLELYPSVLVERAPGWDARDREAASSDDQAKEETA